MKRIIAIFLLIFTLLAFTACNYQFIDTTYAFDYAIISYGNGVTEKIKIKSWRDYEDGEQIQITAVDGTVYLVSSFNCVLVKEKP